MSTPACSVASSGAAISIKALLVMAGTPLAIAPPLHTAPPKSKARQKKAFIKILIVSVRH
ncbi:hypothetical protein [Vibrio sp. 10N.222.55.E7]|uniref:hypothetical protein n=1 Tax=Vibrio sp. 10N.222.55.E7 TaxID=3229651 RepID=UPI00113B5449|nr:hypothetical protein FCV67_26460 [Vibrio sp. F13]